MTSYYYMYRSWQDCCRRGENRSWPSVSVESVDSEYWCLNNTIVYAFIMRLTVEKLVLRSTFKLNTLYNGMTADIPYLVCWLVLPVQAAKDCHRHARTTLSQGLDDDLFWVSREAEAHKYAVSVAEVLELLVVSHFPWSLLTLYQVHTVARSAQPTCEVDFRNEYVVFLPKTSARSSGLLVCSQLFMWQRTHLLYMLIKLSFTI